MFLKRMGVVNMFELIQEDTLDQEYKHHEAHTAKPLLEQYDNLPLDIN